MAALREFVAEHGYDVRDVAFMATRSKVSPRWNSMSLPVVFANAHPSALAAAAKLVTQSVGGNGAVRELPAQLHAVRQET